MGAGGNVLKSSFMYPLLTLAVELGLVPLAVITDEVSEETEMYPALKKLSSSMDCRIPSCFLEVLRETLKHRKTAFLGMIFIYCLNSLLC